MANTSYAAQAVAAAPPSFAGMDWLLVVNLSLATLGVLVFSFAARRIWLARHADRDIDRAGSAAELTRRILGLFFAGATLRALSDALQLYGWNPLVRSSGGWATAGRFLDPLGLGLLLAASTIWLLTENGLIGQLRTPPPYHPIWEDRETKRRLCVFAVLAMGMALCPVLFR